MIAPTVQHLGGGASTFSPTNVSWGHERPLGPGPREGGSPASSTSSTGRPRPCPTVPGRRRVDPGRSRDRGRSSRRPDRRGRASAEEDDALEKLRSTSRSRSTCSRPSPQRATSSATSSSPRTRGCAGTALPARRSRERLGAHGVPGAVPEPRGQAPDRRAQGSGPEPSDGAASVARRLAAAGVEAVALAMVDPAGVTRVKCIPIRRFEEVAGFGVGLSNVFLGLPGERRHHVVAGDRGAVGRYPARARPGVGGGAGRLARPGPRGRRPAGSGGRSVAAVRALLRSADARAAWPITGSTPRRVRARVLPREPDLGARGRRARSDPRPAGPGYSAPVLADQEPFATELIRALETQGTGVMQFHPEYSTGQFEISVPHRTGIALADTNLVARTRSSGGAVERARRLVRARRVHRPGGQRRPPALQPVEPPRPEPVPRRRRPRRHDARRGRGVFGGRPRVPAGDRRRVLPSVASTSVSNRTAGADPWACWGRGNREAGLRFVTGMVGSRSEARTWKSSPSTAGAAPTSSSDRSSRRVSAGSSATCGSPNPRPRTPASLSAAVRRGRGISRLPSSLDVAIRGSRFVGPARGDGRRALRSLRRRARASSRRSTGWTTKPSSGHSLAVLRAGLRGEGRVGGHRSLGRTRGGRAHASLPAGGPARTRSGRVRHPRDVPRRVLRRPLRLKEGLWPFVHSLTGSTVYGIALHRWLTEHRVRADARGGGEGRAAVATESRRVHQGAPRRGRCGASLSDEGSRSRRSPPRSSNASASASIALRLEPWILGHRSGTFFVSGVHGGPPGPPPTRTTSPSSRSWPTDRFGRRRPERGRGPGGVLELARDDGWRETRTTRNRSATS